MIIENQQQVTTAVLEAFGRTKDPRTREILLALVKHLHAFVREVRLTEPEFRQATQLIAEIGQKTTPSHNEAVLMAGSLGVSTLICLLNNGNNGATETQANLLGPFWRDDQPMCKSGDSLLRSPTPGPGMLVNCRIIDQQGRPVAGAEVDIWHTSPEGLYENQDTSQAEMNLRGRFLTDANGHFSFTSCIPAGYPIPMDGPAGKLIRATGRHNYRPAHLHFMVHKSGFKTLITQIYSGDDKNIDSDVQFGVTRPLIGHYQRHDAPEPKYGFVGTWYSLDQTLTLEAGEAKRPMAPIRAKTTAAAAE